MHSTLSCYCYVQEIFLEYRNSKNSVQPVEIYILTDRSEKLMVFVKKIIMHFKTRQFFAIFPSIFQYLLYHLIPNHSMTFSQPSSQILSSLILSFLLTPLILRRFFTIVLILQWFLFCLKNLLTFFNF